MTSKTSEPEVKLYRVWLYTNGDSSEGCIWFTSKASAEKKRKEADAEELDEHEFRREAWVETLDVQLTKTSLLRFLNTCCSYPDNG